MDQLTAIVERAREELSETNQVRDTTLRRSRELIRYCAHSIRATHRSEYDAASELLATARSAAAAMTADLQDHPNLFYTGYTLDALKELTEAHITFAWITGGPLPEPEDLGVPYTAYLKGMGEAVAEMRRHVLNLIRRDEVAQGEPFLQLMDEAYSLLMTIDFPDAITGGLRRISDMVRGVVERTRGDLTVAMRQERLEEALRELEERVLDSEL
jgi:translin